MMPTDPELTDVLSRARTIAVVGLSDKPDRDSNRVARYLREQGYRIVPVNPAVREVLGAKAYPSVAHIPADVGIDLVDIFRRSEDVPPVVDEALARGVRVVWMQLGVAHAGAAEKARARGALVVENACLKVEHDRLGIAPVGPAP